MHIHCPQCQTEHELNSQQLREQQGIVRCEQCSSLFDVLPSLYDAKSPAELAAPKPSTTKPSLLPWEAEPTKLNVYWKTALVINSLLLLVQLFYFTNLTQQVQVRHIASQLQLPLPTYQNVADITVLHTSLDSQADNTRLFKVALVNQGEFAQNYPKIKLSLLNEQGGVFSQRIFKPSEYLPQKSAPLLNADASLEFSLQLAELKTPIQGYTVDLVGYFN